MAESRELDMTGAKQSTRMWLVRVLCYLSLQWAKAQRSEVLFTLIEALANTYDIGRKIASVNKLSLEGIVVQRRLQIEDSSNPVRLPQHLDKAVTTNYKPVANHQYNIEYKRKKKEDGKQLVSAFEKHQYYNLKDLEILKEIGIQNVKGIHKNTWELKPEYRHSQGEEKSD
ncbi:hypothetical protein FD755_016094 [Muntiacus reevesi]|uniref:General transcription factor IIF subunit 2 n=1 Tax=Muntiacus reevesi TaxID=9886 RepID=A0A5N3XF77_MUNRE|nr:hypothetical protein FD755_016094 [Muntiacus reevesi]